MPVLMTHPVFLISLAAGFAGALLLVQARMQSRLLRRRIAAGEGTAAMDQATGLFGPAAAWQCLRGESNRAARLARPLQVWVATAEDAQVLDGVGRALAFELPAGMTAFRVDARHVCLVSCATTSAPSGGTLDELAWSHASFAAGEQTADDARTFITEVTAHG